MIARTNGELRGAQPGEVLVRRSCDSVKFKIQIIRDKMTLTFQLSLTAKLVAGLAQMSIIG